MPRNKAQENDDFHSAAIHRAAILAATGMTQKSIARELGVSESQVSRWARLPEFIATKNAVMADAIDTASARLRALAVAAVGVLRDAMEDPKASPADRIRAAGIILDRVVGDCGASTIGPTDERVIEAKIASQKRQAEMDAAFDEMMASWTT